jgi:hypothetical protein
LAQGPLKGVKRQNNRDENADGVDHPRVRIVEGAEICQINNIRAPAVFDSPSHGRNDCWEFSYVQ